MNHLKFFQFTGVLQQEGWVENAVVGIANDGTIQHLDTQAPQGIALEHVQGYAMPGFFNAHSHAFQYVMSGIAEQRLSNDPSNFWSWREIMYQCALALNPAQMEAVATMLYAEMLRHGYTHVAEFHYLHHDKKGKPYRNEAEMGEQLIRAAQTAGIHITLIPIFYQTGGFDRTAFPEQKRFILPTVDAYLDLLNAANKLMRYYDHARMGWGVHSLRAVSLTDIQKVWTDGLQELPFHIHVSEQQKEVHDCQQYCGQKPVEWLLNNLPVNEQFHLIHATHIDDKEMEGIVRSGAHVVLCPSTEANLGDGFFDFDRFMQQGGKWSIGTDSHIQLNPLEELRMLDYQQRLSTQQRHSYSHNPANTLIQGAHQGGLKAMGQEQQSYFEINKPFNALIVDAQSPLIASTSTKHLTAAILYSTDPHHYLGTLVNGQWVVKKGIHQHHDSITKKFNETVRSLNIR